MTGRSLQQLRSVLARLAAIRTTNPRVFFWAIREYGDWVELIELGPLTDEEWEELLAGERQPFGSLGAGVAWRPKDRHIGLRAPNGHLVAVAGAVIVHVEVVGARSFDVVGLGNLIVTRSVRGQGLMYELVEPILRVARDMGPERAMIFCRPGLVTLYRSLSFVEIMAPVWVDQPQGRVQMPQSAMWLPLRDGATWPPGCVDVRSLPF